MFAYVSTEDLCLGNFNHLVSEGAIECLISL